MPLALEGVRIIDLTTWQQGSGGPAMLADLGADVVKIEDPVLGDPSRAVSMSPKEAQSPLRSLFEAMNRNKQGMTLNLKSPEGRQILYRMVQGADVVAMNFRPGVAETLGVDYQTLVKYNPKIIVASTNGLGAKGPDASVGLYDIMGHARSGLMTLLSDPEQPLRYVGAWGLSDQTAAIMLAYSILAALVARSNHGEGQEVTSSQLGSAMTWQTLAIQSFLFSNEQPKPLSREKSRSPLFNIYRAKDDRWLCLACTQSERYWPDVLEVLGLANLKEDPTFATEAARSENSAQLITILDERFLSQDRDEWVRALNAHGVLVSAVQDYHDLVRDPQVEANHYIVEMDHPSAGPVKVLGVPLSFSKTPTRAPKAAPEFGQHTETVLLELGYSWDEITNFRDGGV
ncbi:MAG: CoA transferase, partial [Chloroflexi bacterium]|nr:CoA transferase [Chloroflexota bacterium]